MCVQFSEQSGTTLPHKLIFLIYQLYWIHGWEYMKPKFYNIIVIKDITHQTLHKSALFSTLDVFLPPKGLHQCLNYPWFSSLPCCSFTLWKVRASAGKGCTSSMCCKVQFSFLWLHKQRVVLCVATCWYTECRLLSDIICTVSACVIHYFSCLLCSNSPALWTLVWSTGNFTI